MREIFLLLSIGTFLILLGYLLGIINDYFEKNEEKKVDHSNPNEDYGGECFCKDCIKNDKI